MTPPYLELPTLTPYRLPKAVAERLNFLESMGRKRIKPNDLGLYRPCRHYRSVMI